MHAHSIYSPSRAFNLYRLWALVAIIATSYIHDTSEELANLTSQTFTSKAIPLFTGYPRLLRNMPTTLRMTVAPQERARHAVEGREHGAFALVSAF